MDEGVGAPDRDRRRASPRIARVGSNLAEACWYPPIASSHDRHTCPPGRRGVLDERLPCDLRDGRIMRERQGGWGIVGNVRMIDS
jgi:hypothetical protein